MPRLTNGQISESYNAIHKWLGKKYGKAYHCEGKDCGGKSKVYEWALITDKEYKRERASFIQLCKSCHLKYDYNEVWALKLGQSRKGSENGNRAIYQCNLQGEIIRKFKSTKFAAQSLLLKPSTISAGLSGSTKIVAKKWIFKKDGMYTKS